MGDKGGKKDKAKKQKQDVRRNKTDAKDKAAKQPKNRTEVKR